MTGKVEFDPKARFETIARVGPDGRLTITLPSEFAGADVWVRIDPVAAAPPARRQMDREQWRQFLAEVAGSITDPTFERPPQLEF